MTDLVPGVTPLIAFAMATAPDTEERLETPTELRNTGSEAGRAFLTARAAAW